MLSAEETVFYLRKAKTGDNRSKEILLEHNALLLKSLIRRFKNKGVEYDDLYQLACIGFLKAIDRFDEKFEVRFSTYAVPMIVGRINRFIESYRGSSGEGPSIEEIASALNIDREDVVLALDSSRMPLSLYEKTDDSGDNKSELIDKIPSGEREEDMIDKILLKSMIESLPPRERKVIVMRYYRDKTQSEIARALGVSQVQVSRIENKIIASLKEKI